MKRVWNRGVDGVKVAEVGSVDWFNRVNNGWQKGEVFRVVLEGDAGRFVEFTDMVSAIAEGFSDSVRSTEAVREFSDAVECGVALDLNTNKDEVVGSEVGSRATFVDTVSVSLTAIFDN